MCENACEKMEKDATVKLVTQLLSSLTFREVDREVVDLGGASGKLTFRLRRNEKTGEEYVILDQGAEAPAILDRDRLDSIIVAAQAIRARMTNDEPSAKVSSALPIAPAEIKTEDKP